MGLMVRRKCDFCSKEMAVGSQMQGHRHRVRLEQNKHIDKDSGIVVKMVSVAVHVPPDQDICDDCAIGFAETMLKEKRRSKDT